MWWLEIWYPILGGPQFLKCVWISWVWIWGFSWICSWIFSIFFNLYIPCHRSYNCRAIAPHSKHLVRKLSVLKWTGGAVKSLRSMLIASSFFWRCLMIRWPVTVLGWPCITFIRVTLHRRFSAAIIIIFNQLPSNAFLWRGWGSSDTTPSLPQRFKSGFGTFGEKKNKVFCSTSSDDWWYECWSYRSVVGLVMISTCLTH